MRASAARAGAAAVPSPSPSAIPMRPARAAQAVTDALRMAASLEVHVPEHEMPGPARFVVALEAIPVIEPDVAEQRDLHAEPDPGSDLQVERLDLAAQVPDVAGVEEKHTV